MVDSLQDYKGTSDQRTGDLDRCYALQLMGVTVRNVVNFISACDEKAKSVRHEHRQLPIGSDGRITPSMSF